MILQVAVYWSSTFEHSKQQTNQKQPTDTTLEAFEPIKAVALLCGGHVYGRCHPQETASGYVGNAQHEMLSWKKSNRLCESLEFPGFYIYTLAFTVGDVEKEWLR